jgi:hypothetical protein
VIRDDGPGLRRERIRAQGRTGIKLIEQIVGGQTERLVFPCFGRGVQATIRFTPKEVVDARAPLSNR